MLGDFGIHASAYGPAARGVFFRRRWNNLEDVIRRSHEIYPKLGARYVGGTESQWRFPNGANLKFRHLWDKTAAQAYQGMSFSRLYFEEITQWPTDEAYNLLRATLRSPEGIPVGLRATGNPGGPGHNWVKARFIDPAPGGYKRIYDKQTKQYRTFIPARLEDNLLLTEQDPGYEDRLLASGPAALVKAWRWGDWDIVAGGFFDHVWNQDRHVLRPFEPPQRWRLRRSHDWGSAKPASTGWWAIADGEPLPEDHPHYPGRVFPRGSLVRLFEWYTVAHDQGGNVKPNEGLKLTNEELGRGIAERSKGRSWSGCVADPSIWNRSGGPSIYKQLQAGARQAGLELFFAPAITDRVAGWKLMAQMLAEAAKERPESPGLWVMDTCTDFIRTVPVLQMDERKPDDIDTEAEDHVADETRYAVMSAGRGIGSQQDLIL